ncbi:FeoA family protein [Clostridium sp. HBUAS56010]|uniref:FeoA family protein n=1 Tax=Clostridium sp. HBUAS56010 TaxID=2571127 RepID=UPI00117740E9|nr:FeoA family protein [Clostridium sp. HBUAS56010]
MKEKISLSNLKRGQKAVILKLAAYDDMRRRLQDIGLIEGTIVECLGKSPLGDPTAFLIRGAVIALRSEDAGRVLIRVEDETVLKRHYEEEVAAAAVPQEEEQWD